MNFRSWLEREGISFSEMGQRIERTGEAVRRYATGERIPDRETMPKIVRETRGEVTANDFFDIELPSDGPDTASPEITPTGQSTEMSGEFVASERGTA